MTEWLDNIAGPGYAAALLWTFAALVLLVIVLVIIKLVRSLTFGTFVAGGRNRKTRLAVMDATAVDSQRRLVLVRRDDVEHLLLIGGPTDVVVERDIRLGAPRRPALTAADNPHESPQPARPRAPEPAPARPAPQQRPAAVAPTRPAPAPQPAALKMPPATMPRATAAAIPSASYGLTNLAPRPTQPPAPAFAPAPTPAQRDTVEDTFMKELEVSFDEPMQGDTVRSAADSLDDEMAKLLGELANHKK